MDKYYESEKWPDHCIWPSPLNEAEGEYWDYDIGSMVALDQEGEDLLEIRDYYNELVEEGILDEDYCLLVDDFEPKNGMDFWNDGFDPVYWEEVFCDHLNHLKLRYGKSDPVNEIRQIIDYEFVNENILRQAFTRKAFGLEHKVADSEVLEFLGDMVIHSVITREMAKAFTRTDVSHTGRPFVSEQNEKMLTKVREHFECKEYLSRRCVELGLDRFILYGSNEKETDSSYEDALEALIGAVAVDSNWNWSVLESVTDKLIEIQFSKPDLLLKDSFYDLFNAWHQRKFHQMPIYEVYGSSDHFYCTLRYFVPENDQNINTDQRVDVEAESRSKARERAAIMAYDFVRRNGLWMNLKDAAIIPNIDNSINQLQELFQKKYIEKPEYRFEEDDGWRCDCICNGINGWGTAKNKISAKKKAAYMVLVRLFDSAGLCKEEWKEKAWKMSVNELWASDK